MLVGICLQNGKASISDGSNTSNTCASLRGSFFLVKLIGEGGDPETFSPWRRRRIPTH